MHRFPFDCKSRAPAPRSKATIREFSATFEGSAPAPKQIARARRSMRDRGSNRKRGELAVHERPGVFQPGWLKKSLPRLRRLTVFLLATLKFSFFVNRK